MGRHHDARAPGHAPRTRSPGPEGARPRRPARWSPPPGWAAGRRGTALSQGASGSAARARWAAESMPGSPVTTTRSAAHAQLHEAAGRPRRRWPPPVESRPRWPAGARGPATAAVRHRAAAVAATSATGIRPGRGHVRQHRPDLRLGERPTRPGAARPAPGAWGPPGPRADSPATSAGMAAASLSAEGEKWVKTTWTPGRAAAQRLETARACSPSPTDGAWNQTTGRVGSRASPPHRARCRSAPRRPAMPRASLEAAAPGSTPNRGPAVRTPAWARRYATDTADMGRG